MQKKKAVILFRKRLAKISFARGPFALRKSFFWPAKKNPGARLFFAGPNISVRTSKRISASLPLLIQNRTSAKEIFAGEFFWFGNSARIDLQSAFGISFAKKV